MNRGLEGPRRRSLAWIALRIAVVAFVLGLSTSIVVAWSCSTRAAIRGWPRVSASKDLLVPSYHDLGWRIIAHGHRDTGVSIYSSMFLMELGDEPSARTSALERATPLEPWERPAVEAALAMGVSGRTPTETRAANLEAIRQSQAKARAKHGNSLEHQADAEPVDPWAGQRVSFGRSFHVLAAGWPRPCLQADYAMDTDAVANTLIWSSESGIIPWNRVQSPPPSPAMQGLPPIWPLRPIWPGLLTNTAFFGAIWLIPLAFVPALRRAHRRRRGRCVVCAYDLSATPIDAPCPECGGVRAA